MIKSNITEAYSISEMLTQRGGCLAPAPMTTAYETNIPAMETAARVYEQIESAKSRYKQTLCAAAGNIASLGEEFEHFDQAVGMSVKSIF